MGKFIENHLLFFTKKKIRKIRQIFRHYYIQVKRNIKKIPLT